MFRVGDYVTRKKYNHDILFQIKEINNNKIVLKGVDIRLYADALEDDLIKRSIKRKNNDIEYIEIEKKENSFLIPGHILHIDSDKDYLNKCLDYYKNNHIKCYGFVFKEQEYSIKIIDLLEKFNPNIVVITGHDAYYKLKDKYKNSKYYIDCVKKIRKSYSKFENLIIIAGACQSDFEGLIKAGATYASSPNHINISALDPAIIASYIALTEKTNIVDLEGILNKTSCGPEGIGGIKTYGVMLYGFPRKDKN